MTEGVSNKRKNGIDVTVVLFFNKKRVPSSIKVSEITLPLTRKIPGYLTGLSGHQRLEGLMFARQYADQNDLRMIVIDLVVEFEKPRYLKIMGYENLKDHDVFVVSRITKDFVGILANYWFNWIPKKAAQDIDWARPSDFIAHHPEYIPDLLQLDDFKHVNIITFPVFTTFHDKPLTATAVRTDYGKITKASARFHDIEVILDTPGSAE